MLNKLTKIATKYEELQQQLYDPAISSDHQKMTKLNREISALQETYELYTYLKKRDNQKSNGFLIVFSVISVPPVVKSLIQSFILSDTACNGYYRHFCHFNFIGSYF